MFIFVHVRLSLWLILGGQVLSDKRSEFLFSIDPSINKVHFYPLVSIFVYIFFYFILFYFIFFLIGLSNAQVSNTSDCLINSFSI